MHRDFVLFLLPAAFVADEAPAARGRESRRWFSLLKYRGVTRYQSKLQVYREPNTSDPMRLIIFSFLLALSIPFAGLAQTSWKGTVSVNWSTAGNWTAGVPTAAMDAIVGDASFTGPNQPDLSGNSACKSLTIGAGAKVSTLKVDKNLTISGNLIIGANGTINHTARTISLTGNWTNSGAYSASGNKSTVTFSGVAQSLNGNTTTFRKLTINASSITALNANVAVAVQLTVSGALDPNEAPTRAVAGAGKLVVNSGGKLQVKAATFAGNYGLTGAKTLNVGSTVDYAATTVNQTVNNTFVYGTLRVSGALTKTLPGNLPALASSAATSGNLLVDGGVFDLVGSTANRGTTVVGGTLSVANGATLKIGGANSFPANYRTHSLGVSSTVEYSGSNQTVTLESYGNLTLSTGSGTVVKTLPASALTVAGNLTSTAGVGSSVSFTAAAPVTVRGNLSLGQGTTFNGGAFAHSIGANWGNNGTFNGGSSQVTLSGSSAVVSGTGTNRFNDLIVAGAGVTAAASTDLSIAGSLSTTGVGSFTHNSGGTGKLTMSGSGKTISGNGIALNHLAVPGSVSTISSLVVAGDLMVDGSFLATAGTTSLSGSAKVLSGTGPVTFSGLNISGGITTTRNFAVTANLSVLGSFTATAGTATFAGSSILSGTATLFNATLNGSRLQLGPGSVLGIRGALALSAGVFDATTTLPNTVNYNAAGPQTVTAAGYGNLVFSGSGTKTAGGPLVVNEGLTIGSGTTFAAGSFVHTLYGDWINQGTFAPGGGAIQLLGSQDASISGPTTFGILTVNKASPGNVVSLADSVTVATLNMANGSVLTGTNAVTITSDRTGNGIILGTITRTHPFLVGVPYAFESPYNTINFTSGGGVSSVTESVVPGPVLDFPFGASINRQYAINLTSSSPYTGALRLHYQDSGLNGNTEPGMQLWHFNAGWALSGKTANDSTNNWVEQSSLTDLTGRWTLSDDLNVVRWTGLVSSAWENAGNWIAAQGGPALPPSTNDIVELGVTPFTNQPRITTAAVIRSVSFGSVQPVNLTLDVGGSLDLAGNAGNITGSWTNNVTHAINVGAQALRVGGVFLLGDGTNGHAINLNIGSGIVSISDDFTQAGGAQVTFTGSGRFDLGGNFNHTSGTFAPGTGTVNYNGAGPQVVAGNVGYHHLILSKTAGTATLSAPSTIGGDLTLTNAGTFLVNAPLTVTNNVVVGAGTTLNGDSSTLHVGGNWTRTGTFVPGTGTVIFDGSGPQSIEATTFNNLTMNKPSGAATLSANLTVNGNLSIASGILDLSTNTANRGALGGAFTLAAGSTLRIGSGSSFPANFAARSIANSSTVEYRGAGPQVVSENAYGNLAFSNGGANPKALAGDTSVAGDLVINAGATFLAGTFTIDVQGNWTNNGAFLPGAGSVTLSGAGRTLSGPTVFNQLTVSGGYAASSDITVNGAMSVSGTYASGATTQTFSGDFADTGSFTSGGTVIFTGTGPQLIGLNSGFASSGAVNFNGTATPTFTGLTAPVLQNVNINNTGSIAPVTGWTVGGNFAVGTGATFDGGLVTHTFKGSFNNNGTVTSSGTLAFLPSSAATLNLNGTAFASTGTIIFGGSGQISFGNGPLSFHSVTVANNHPAGITPASNWTLSGDLSISTGALFNGGTGLTLTVAGTFNDSGTFNGAASTVVMNGDTDIAGSGSTTFNHLSIAGTVTASTDFDVAGNFTNNGLFDGTGSTVSFVGSAPSILGGTTSPALFDSLRVAKTAAPVNLAINLNGLTDLTLSGGTLDVSTFTVSEDAAGGALTIGPGAALRIGGVNSLPAFGVNNLDAGSTVEYYGTGSQPIAAVNYGNLVSSSTGGRVLPSGAVIGIAGVFTPGANAYTIAGNTIDFNGAGSQVIPAFNYNNIASSSTGARVLSSSGNIGVAGAFTPGPNTYTVTNSTISFNGVTQTVPAFTYHNLSITGSGTKTLGGDITVNGALGLSAGTLADAGFTATVKGDAGNDAAHTGNGKIVLTQGSAEHVLSGRGSYGNLELSDTNGASLSLTNLTVNGTLTFTKGLITTSTNKVILNGVATVSRIDGHVVGNLQKAAATGVSRTNVFEVGDAGSYAPISLVVSNVTVAGTVTACTTPGDHPDILNSGVSATRGVNRYWTLTRSGLVFTSYNALFNFVPGDLDTFANSTNFTIAQRTGGTWTLRSPGLITATNILAAGLTAMSDFAVGEVPPARPTITSQPVGQRVNIGASASFNLSVTGVGILTYQWRLNGTSLPGATSPTLVLPSVQDTDAGNYSVVVDDGSSTISSNAFLTINHAPTLPPMAPQTVNEGNLFTISTTASDTDGGPIAYTLVAAPTGATIDSSGLISWTPAETQGPSTNVFTTKVTDNGAPGLSATNAFTVVVSEVNAPPVVTVPGPQTIRVGATLIVTNTAADVDIPANLHTFSLVSAPAGMVIDSTTGVITWTPPVSQQSSTNMVAVNAADNGQPPLNDTKSFTVTVVGLGQRITAIEPTNGVMVLTLEGISGETYHIQATPTLTSPIPWAVIGTNTAGTDGLSQFIDTETPLQPIRFYRSVKP